MMPQAFGMRMLNCTKEPGMGDVVHGHGLCVVGRSINDHHGLTPPLVCLRVSASQVKIPV